MSTLFFFIFFYVGIVPARTTFSRAGFFVCPPQADLCDQIAVATVNNFAALKRTLIKDMIIRDSNDLE